MSQNIDIPILSIFFGGGLIVVLSYIFLWKSGIFKEVYPVFKNNKEIFTWWIISAFLTVISVFAIIIYFSFFQDMRYYYSWQRPFFIASLSSFLFFAIMWSISLYFLIKKNKLVRYQQIPLILTALSTIGMLCAIINDMTPWLIILAGVIIVFHHFFFDGMLWVEIHEDYIQNINKYNRIILSKISKKRNKKEKKK